MELGQSSTNETFDGMIRSVNVDGGSADVWLHSTQSPAYTNHELVRQLYNKIRYYDKLFYSVSYSRPTIGQ